MNRDEQFECIYAETRDDLLRFLLIRTNASLDTEDLLQEIYCRFFIRITRSVVPIITPKRFLFSIAKKVLAKYYQVKSRRKENEQSFVEESFISATDYLIDADEYLFVSEQKDIIWKLLQDEPDLSRRAFILYYGCDQSQKEISEALGISEEAVKQRLYRTRCRIHALLKQEKD